MTYYQPSKFKRLLRRPAIIFVTLWAKVVYAQGVRAAEKRRLYEIDKAGSAERGRNCMVYLAANSFRPDHLVTYDKAQFKTEKKVYGMAARLLTMDSLKRGCYYHTADRYGRNGMDAKDIKIRKKAFVKERLKLAELF